MAEPRLQRVGRTRGNDPRCGPFQPRRGRSGNPRGQRTAGTPTGGHPLCRHAGTSARGHGPHRKQHETAADARRIRQTQPERHRPVLLEPDGQPTGGKHADESLGRPAPPSQRPRLVAIQEERRRIRQARPQGPGRHDQNGEPPGRGLRPDRHRRIRHHRHGGDGIRRGTRQGHARPHRPVGRQHPGTDHPRRTGISESRGIQRGTDPGGISRSGRNLRVQPAAARTPQGRRRLFPRPITCGEIPMGRQRGRADRETPRDRRDNQAGRPSRMVHHGVDRPSRTGDERPVRQYGNSP